MTHCTSASSSIDEIAAQDREARARQPRAALHVDPLAGELEVVAPAGRRRSSPTTRSTSSSGSAAVGSGRLGSVRRTSCSSASASRACSPRALTSPDSTFRCSSVPDDVAALALAGGDLLGGGLLLGAQRLGGLRRLAPARVELDDAVEALDGVRPAPRQRGPNRLGVAADQPEVQHGERGYCRPASARRRPAYFARNSATLLRLLAGDDVLGHDRAGEAAVLDREEDVLDGLLAVVEVRPVDALAVGHVERRALRPGDAERVAGAAALDEDRAPRRGPDRPRRARCSPSRSRR